MAVTTYFAVVLFIQLANGEIVQTTPKSVQGKYASLREACFSVGTKIAGDRVVGAIVFAKEREEDGELGELTVIGRYGIVPDAET